MADQKLTALTELSVPALEDLAYIVDDPAGTPASYKVTHARQGGLYLPGICDGRLTTESGVPVSTSDRTAQSTIYFTPYLGSRLALYDGTRWALYAFTEFSLALSGLTSGWNYDVFAHDNSGTLTLSLEIWTNNTTRATALTTQNGVLVKSGATTHRYLGSLRTTGTTTTEDSGGGSSSQVGGKRFLWNYYHRVRRSLYVYDSTDSWTYTTNSWRQANNAAGNQVEFVCGVAEDCLEATVIANVQPSNGAYGAAGIGLDSTVAAVQSTGIGYISSTAAYNTAIIGKYVGVPGIGWHYVAWIENGLGSGAGLLWYGDGGSQSQSGLHATVWG